MLTCSAYGLTLSAKAKGSLGSYLYTTIGPGDATRAWPGQSDPKACPGPFKARECQSLHCKSGVGVSLVPMVGQFWSRLPL